MEKNNGLLQTKYIEIVRQYLLASGTIFISLALWMNNKSVVYYLSLRPDVAMIDPTVIVALAIVCRWSRRAES